MITPVKHNPLLRSNPAAPDLLGSSIYPELDSILVPERSDYFTNAEDFSAFFPSNTLPRDPPSIPSQPIPAQICPLTLFNVGLKPPKLYEIVQTADDSTGSGSKM